MSKEIQFDPALKEILLRATGNHLGESIKPASSEKVPVVVRLENASAQIPELNIVSRMGNIVTGRLALDQIVSLRQHPDVASLKASSGFSEDLSNSIKEIHATKQPLMHRGTGDIRGKGVIIGVIDWGADFAHEAFLDSNKKSRILYLWDQRGGESDKSPQPYGYGREFTQYELNKALKSKNPYQYIQYDPAQIDRQGQGTHGTHVMSIAAGSGRYKGVAPDAQLIFVHLRGVDTAPEDTLGDSVRVLEAVDYILKKAGDIPVVLNLSLGRTGDAKDGSSPVEQALDAVLAEKPGRAICMSTGNYYQARLHSFSIIKNGKTKNLRWQLPLLRRDIAELEIWYSGGDRFNVVLISPNGVEVASVGLGESKVIQQGGKILASIYHRFKDPNNGDNQINIFLHEKAPPGTWNVQVRGEQVVDGKFHAWIERSDVRSQSRFHPMDVSRKYTIGTICTGHLTISTGAYQPTDPVRSLGVYSSSGPSRDNRKVPVISAPGDRIFAAKSSTSDLLGRREKDAYTIKSGTSMAAPHVAGTVALMMDAALPEKLSALEIREILISRSRTVSNSNKDSKLRYGAGLLDASAAVKEVLRRYGKDKTRIHNTLIEDVVMKNEMGAYEENDYHEQDSGMYELVTGEEDVISEYARPTLVNNRVTMEWQSLSLVVGSGGARHLYYLTTGHPDTGIASFKVRIQNKTKSYMRNATIKWRLSRRKNDGTYETVVLNGQENNQSYHSSSAPSIGSNSEAIRTMLVNRNILEGAYNSNSPLCRMEVEFHWYEGSTPYYSRHALGFFLFKPVEFLFAQGRIERQVSFSQSQYKNTFWLAIRAKHFKRDDQQPVTLSTTISTSITAGSSSSVSVSATTSETNSVTQGQSTTVGTSTSASLSIGIGKIVEAGVESGMTTEQTQSISWSRSLSQSFSRQLSSSRSFAETYKQSQTVNWVIQPSPAGTVRTLYAYPVFNLWRVKVVNFGQANSMGQATQRIAYTNFPILKIRNWVDISEVVRSNTGEEFNGEVLDGDDGLIESYVNTQDFNHTGQYGFGERVSKLSANQVTHLALEGGGGKGVVYLGAIQALEQLNILRYSGGKLQNIQGISGSSAGAITALALSIGMDAQGLQALMRGSQRMQFNEFFDLPTDPRKVPKLDTNCASINSSSVMDRYFFDVIKQAVDSVPLISGGMAQQITNQLRQKIYNSAVDQSLAAKGAGAKLLSPALIYYLTNLVEDFGIFSGCRARSFFDNLLAQRTGGQRNLTFRQHRQRFGVKLVITGSNLESGTNEFFSVDTTPNMAVADAIRISMSLPIIFKPVRISSSESLRISGSEKFSGLWVDGGLWNNLPMRAFDSSGVQGGTFGIRLGVEGRVRIRDFMGFLKRYVVDFGVMGSGETGLSQTSELLPRVVALSTGSIDTTNFDVPDAVANPLINKAKAKTLDYFT